ncbi:MAG: membrane dipeptidase [Pseudomonadota bacterium]
MNTPALNRRRFGCLAAGTLLASVRPAPAQPQRQFMGDMHSHYGMFLPRNGGLDMGQHLRDTGTTLLAWTIVDDAPWITSTPQGIKQSAQPAPGALWDNFRLRVTRYDAALRSWNLPKVLVASDLDAALAGDARVVMASESANFLEGRPERVAQAHAMGLRHLQMVHYIDTPLGDRQTEPPLLNGLPPATLQVIRECKRLGVLVDLAHGTPDFVDAALAASDAVMIWSHSWISRSGGTWRDYAYVARSLSPAQAKKIVAHGGVVGLWTVRVRADSKYPLYSVSSYADEIMRMADLLGPDGVAFGTDMEGAGSNPVMNNYTDLREVAENLAKRGLSGAAFSNICIGNYARVLRKAMTVT